MQAVVILIVVCLGLIIIFLGVAMYSIAGQLKQSDQRLNNLEQQAAEVAARESQYERDAVELETRRTALEEMIQRNKREQERLLRNVTNAERALAESRENMVTLTNLTTNIRYMLTEFVIALKDDKKQGMDLSAWLETDQKDTHDTEG